MEHVVIRFVFSIPYNLLFKYIYNCWVVKKNRNKDLFELRVKKIGFFKKVYVVSTFRRDIWEANLDYINQHNEEFQRGEHSYTLGLNEFADLVT